MTFQASLEKLHIVEGLRGKFYRTGFGYSVGAGDAHINVKVADENTTLKDKKRDDKGNWSDMLLTINIIPYNFKSSFIALSLQVFLQKHSANLCAITKDP